ncbi:MAG: biotin/lipoyl-binding protein, partial [Planctomycetota bacterium]|nr:biotin/lipoyl-binding protein [Planctomycetota bacterium]
MSSPSKGQHSRSTETPIREDRYMGFRFIEYADRYDFQLAGASNRLSRSLGGFTLLVLGGLITVGLLVSVHVKAPISGQMEARHPQFVPARFKGKVLKVEVRNKQTVKAGQLLLMVDAAEQEKHVSRLKNQLSS